MQKVVVKTSRSKPDDRLISLLRELFPTCEICIVNGKNEIRETANGSFITGACPLGSEDQ